MRNHHGPFTFASIILAFAFIFAVPHVSLYFLSTLDPNHKTVAMHDSIKAEIDAEHIPDGYQYMAQYANELGSRMELYPPRIMCPSHTFLHLDRDGKESSQDEAIFILCAPADG